MQKTLVALLAAIMLPFAMPSTAVASSSAPDGMAERHAKPLKHRAPVIKQWNKAKIVGCRGNFGGSDSIKLWLRNDTRVGVWTRGRSYWEPLGWDDEWDRSPRVAPGRIVFLMLASTAEPDKHRYQYQFRGPRGQHSPVLEFGYGDVPLCS